MTVPFFPPDLFEADRAVLLDLVREIGTDPRQTFILGPRTARFERELADSVGAREAVCCGSGTGALTLVLAAMGVGPGDEVVVPALGCAPLAATVVNLGATPVFADVDAYRLVVDPDRAAGAVTSRTRALMPAHLFSTMADMPRFRDLASAYRLRLVEDSAVGQGGVLAGVPAGRWGDAGVYSFVQVKTFGTAGEGGAVVTDDEDLARTVRRLRNHGQRSRFRYAAIGYNSRFDEVLAAFQSYRLPGFPARLARRAAIADHYSERFAGLPGVLAPPPGRDGRCAYVYTLLADRRDELSGHLAAHGIESHVYYPRALPYQPAFARYAPPGVRWPHAESAADRMLSIPVHHLLTDAQVEHIADTVCSFAAARVA
ncbi:DegT/DnrJ/EryC1/StrS family aminotransferase [Actinocatenispora rupis]|uniref:Erythromycin biosynthesis sensory transduction protein EryC1 n=1 Tax=Actinocatenispora rupis TaxID=519421 RepID=A0A8J3N9D7_9ACTN|nr:DegT/DnrJ/EryC1/StrS family aminotransferase [Actinocatenispora rupis]GID11016.1 erythromycin biosynthesis sensory transduction protein EryC1 [Actinocatenispora rupis]